MNIFKLLTISLNFLRRYCMSLFPLLSLSALPTGCLLLFKRLSDTTCVPSSLKSLTKSEMMILLSHLNGKYLYFTRNTFIRMLLVSHTGVLDCFLCTTLSLSVLYLYIHTTHTIFFYLRSKERKGMSQWHSDRLGKTGSQNQWASRL